MITFVDNSTFYNYFDYFFMKLGEKITKLKKLKSLSQVALAEATGISRDAISKYERVADALGVSLDYLMSDSDKEEVLDNDAVKRIKEIQTLPFSEKDKIYSVIDALIRDYKTKKAYA